MQLQDPIKYPGITPYYDVLAIFTVFRLWMIRLNVPVLFLIQLQDPFKYPSIIPNYDVLAIFTVFRLWMLCTQPV